MTQAFDKFTETLNSFQAQVERDLGRKWSVSIPPFLPSETTHTGIALIAGAALAGVGFLIYKASKKEKPTWKDRVALSQSHADEMSANHR